MEQFIVIFKVADYKFRTKIWAKSKENAKQTILSKIEFLSIEQQYEQQDIPDVFKKIFNL